MNVKQEDFEDVVVHLGLNIDEYLLLVEDPDEFFRRLNQCDAVEIET